MRSWPEDNADAGFQFNALTRVLAVTRLWLLREPNLANG